MILQFVYIAAKNIYVQAKLQTKTINCFVFTSLKVLRYKFSIPHHWQEMNLYGNILYKCAYYCFLKRNKNTPTSCENEMKIF